MLQNYSHLTKINYYTLVDPLIVNSEKKLNDWKTWCYQRWRKLCNICEKCVSTETTATGTTKPEWDLTFHSLLADVMDFARNSLRRILPVSVLGICETKMTPPRRRLKLDKLSTQPCLYDVICTSFKRVFKYWPNQLSQTRNKRQNL